MSPPITVVPAPQFAGGVSSAELAPGGWRERIAQLAAGDSLALPPPAVAYLERMRELGFTRRLIDIERDSWILITAHMPDQVPGMMALKQAQLEHEAVRGLYLDLADLVALLDYWGRPSGGTGW